MNLGEGFAFYYWHRTMYPKSTCDGWLQNGCRFEWSSAQKLILAPSPAPPRFARCKLGWSIPNSAELIIAVKNATTAGKRVVVEPMVNGPLGFYAEDIV